MEDILCYDHTRESTLSQIKKIPRSKIKPQVSNMSDIFKCSYDGVKFACASQELHVVCDSYLESSLKECERIGKKIHLCLSK